MNMPKPLRERIALATEFAADVKRLFKCAASEGLEATDDDVVRAWCDYSETICAGWLTPPEDDSELRDILLKHLPSPIGSRLRFRLTLADARDAPDELWLPLPESLLEAMGWKIGDQPTSRRLQ